jgi:hypothetical protein
MYMKIFFKTQNMKALLVTSISDNGYSACIEKSGG